MADIDDQILADAAKPLSVTNGDVSTTRRSLREQIEADKYLEQKAAAGSPFDIFKANTRKIVPPGACE